MAFTRREEETCGRVFGGVGDHAPNKGHAPNKATKNQEQGTKHLPPDQLLANPVIPGNSANS